MTFRTDGPRLGAMTARELLALWPKPSLETVSGDTGVSLHAVRKWSHRRSIPAEYWLVLVRAARERGIEGVTFEALAAAHAKRSLVEDAEPAEARP